jgi:hypothetical protein
LWILSPLQALRTFPWRSWIIHSLNLYLVLVFKLHVLKYLLM